MATETLTSWGRVQRSQQEVTALASRFEPLPDASTRTLLPYGNGRSYGDSCLNPCGMILKTRRLDRFISFDPEAGVIACEAGVLLSEVLDIVVPRGWFLPVTPGTRFVTVGGAIANDVHGKNHHVAGTFGCHVLRFELLRSAGDRLVCSASENPGYFAATIGGLGLTGLITWVEFRLRRIETSWIDAETVRYRSLSEFFDLCEKSDRAYEYTVAWVDCAGRGARVGRGLFMRGNHAPAGAPAAKHAFRKWKFPFVPPVSLVNALTLRPFNTAYYYRQFPRERRRIQHYEPFFYPLDGVLEWNRIYGPRGFYQYQCVIPPETGEEAMRTLLEEVASSGMGSFLAVLKVCGARSSPGMLSFPKPGVSLALDFPNRGEMLHRLFDRLDQVVDEAGGRLYPAKDARMPGALFRKGFPRWEEFSQYRDPHFDSSFWRRVTEGV